MQVLRNSKKVSWASGSNLCQTRLFLTEDSPAKVGLAAQDHLQEKASWTFQSGEIGSDGNLPPGFGSSQPVGVLKINLAQIPLIKWTRPSRFTLDPSWRIVSGEESQDVDTQKQREMRVLEAIYPRKSAIPANPVLVGAEMSFHSDQHTLVVPITPIEDEDAINDCAMNSPAVALAHQMASSGSTSSVEPHLVAAVAEAAMAAVKSNNDQIDPNFLMKILSNPQLIEQLVKVQGGSSEMPNLPATSTKIEPAQGYFSRPEPSTTSAVAASSSSVYPPSLRQPLPNVSSPSSSLAPASKDVNYYRSLIQQHGGERQDNLPNFSGGNKVARPCMFFNTPRGCRNGENCAFEHGPASQQRVNPIPDVQNNKRMKMDGGIYGR